VFSPSVFRVESSLPSYVGTSSIGQNRFVVSTSMSQDGFTLSRGKDSSLDGSMTSADRRDNAFREKTESSLRPSALSCDPRAILCDRLHDSER